VADKPADPLDVVTEALLDLAQALSAPLYTQNEDEEKREVINRLREWARSARLDLEELRPPRGPSMSGAGEPIE
jgi:hypothetical protein